MDNQYLAWYFSGDGSRNLHDTSSAVRCPHSVSKSSDIGVCGTLLPPMIMVVLVCFGLSSLQIASLDRLGVSLIALTAVTTLQLSIGNPLLSILVGTGVYTLGIQWFGIVLICPSISINLVCNETQSS